MTLLLAALCVLPSCASSQRNPLAARQRAYQRLISLLEPGMTRRQLYALLPPQRAPSYTVSTSPFPAGSHFLPGPNGYYSEIHPLDPEFHLTVSYLLAHPDSPPVVRHSITQKAIDRLLFGPSFPTKTIRSKQNMEDRLFSRPRITRSEQAHPRTLTRQ